MSDLIRQKLAEIIEQLVIEPLIKYRTAYPCEIVRQADDGTVDLRPDDTSMPSLTGVQIRGLPGVSVKVKPGARALLQFEGGRPTKPICTLFETGSLDSITVTAATKVVVISPSIELGEGASRGVVREGDYGVFTGISPTAGTVTGTFQVVVGSLITKSA